MSRPLRPPRNTRPAAPVAPPQVDDHAIPALTGLRGLAALGVFAFHAWILAGVPDPAPAVPWLGAMLTWLARMGWSGVDVFFTLSAFLLGLPFARAALGGAARPHLPTYLRHRAARILPAYWVQLAILFAFAAAGLSVRGIGEWPGWPALAAHVVLWMDAWPQVRPLLASWWTLPVEFAFYLCLPVLARAFGARRWAWLLLALPIAWLWRAAFLWWPPMGVMTIAWMDHLPGRIDQFAIGLLAAWAWARHEARGTRIDARVANLALAGAAIAFVALPALLLLDGRADPDQTVTLHPVVLAWHSIAGVVVAAGLLACAARAPWSRWLASTPIAWLGTISYSFYLWHLPAIAWIRAQSGDTLERDALWPYFAACLVASLALATLSWWAIERPAQRWARARRGNDALPGTAQARIAR